MFRCGFEFRSEVFCRYGFGFWCEADRGLTVIPLLAFLSSVDLLRMLVNGDPRLSRMMCAVKYDEKHL